MEQVGYQGHYDQIGEGRPLLCFNGFGCANWFLKDMAGRLGNKASFILPDNRGMGNSPEAAAPYSIDDLAMDGLALMDELEHERFVVLGYSMGGFIAQALYFMAPERVDAMILMCTTGAGDQFEPIPVLTPDMLRQSYDMDPRIMIEANIRMTVHPSFPTKHPQRYQAIFDHRLANLGKLDQILLQQQAVNQFLSQPRDLDQIACPTLILAGAQDRFVPSRNSVILDKVIPQTRLHLVDCADHLFFLEQPEETEQQISSFLETL